MAAIERDHFDQPGIAFLTTIGIFTTSNWNNQWYNSNIDFGSSIILYYVFWILLGNWMLFNMFVAILIDGIAQEKKTKFRKQEQVIAEKIYNNFVSLSKEESEAMIETMFKEADIDNSGMVDSSEFERILVKTWGIDLEPKESVLLFRKYDTDDSGLISPEEFREMIKELLNMSKETVKTQLHDAILTVFGGLSMARFRSKTKSMFQQADKDNSRLVSVAVLEKFLQDVYDIHLAPGDFAYLVAKYKRDGNKSHKVSQVEFDFIMWDLLETAKREKDYKRRQSVSVLESLKPPFLAKGKVVSSSGSNLESSKSCGLEDDQAENPMSAKVNSEPYVPSRNSEDGLSTVNIEGPALRRSLFCLMPEHPFRQFCAAILDYPPGSSEMSKVFGNFILVCILASSCALALDNPRVAPGSSLSIGLNNLNSALLIAFNIECFLKIVTESFWGYLSSNWNKLDFFIVLTSDLDALLTVSLTGKQVSTLNFFKILRILRALRPLRLIARAKSLRVLVSALFESIIPILSTCSLMVLAYGMCSLLGMQLLSGKMKTCSNPVYYNKVDCVSNIDPGTSAPGQWVTAQMNWDGFFNGMAAMFILSSQDNWQVYMVRCGCLFLPALSDTNEISIQWQGTDTVSRVEGPYAYNSIAVSIFYVFVVVVSSFVVINLVIAVFVEAYYTATNQLIVTEQKAIEPRINFPTLFEDPENKYSVEISRVVTSRLFDIFIAFFIVTNIIILSLDSYKQASWQTNLSTVANIFYSLVFGWECLFKLGAFGPKRYFASWWNRFDSFIVLISFADILSDGIGHGLPFNPKFLRVLRILRAFRIFKSAKGLMKLLRALYASLPALGNILVLLAIVFFIFAVLGVALFGQLCVQGEDQSPGLEAVRCLFTDTAPGGPLDPKANFRDIGHALISLFRVATTDGWSSFMWSVIQAPQPVRGQISKIVWSQFLAQNGSEAGTMEPPSLDYMELVRQALAGWKEAVTADGSFIPATPASPWPSPNSKAQGWVAVAQAILLNCITDDEASTLEADGLMNCSTLGQYRPCVGTCSANFWVGIIYFCLFTLLTAFVLLQLVIAVLLEQMMNTPGHAPSGARAPGTRALTLRVFGRMHRRWRHTAVQKLRQAKLQRELERVVIASTLQDAEVVAGRPPCG